MPAEHRRRARAATEEPSRRACCLISEVLEEAGLDRENVRKLRRQLLEGVILLCRWQLERMDAPRPSTGKRGRNVAVE